NTINSFGKLIVDSHATTNPIPYSNLDTSPLQPRSGANSAYIEASKKRNRSEDTLPVDTTNPIKKHRSITDMFTMADAVKSDHVGHMVDIASTDDNKPLSKAQCDDIKCKITTALFTKQNISNIKFESSYFDGNKLRMICKNDETKAWLEETVPQLTDLLDGVKIHVINQGAPPKMVAVTISMPANTYEPVVLFQIIKAQNSIDTKFWRYKSRSKVANGRQTWNLSIDENSHVQLKALDYRPYIGFFKLFFVISLTLYSTNGVILDCDYRMLPHGAYGSLYTCTAGILPSFGNRSITDVSHNHLDDRDNDDVKALVIAQMIPFTPLNIHVFFPNLISFAMYNTNTSELTSESLKGLEDLKLFDFGLEDLKLFDFGMNTITTIERDLFAANPSLESVSFERNPLMHVAPKVFDLPSLHTLNIRSTTCIDDLANNDRAAVDSLKFRVIVKCPPTFEMLEEAIINGDQLRNIVKAQVENEVDPIRDILKEIEIEQNLLAERVEALEEALQP
ncbi:hypothetical protein Bhyg_11887, partial [Pseudolycoriella hygida]